QLREQWPVASRHRRRTRPSIHCFVHATTRGMPMTFVFSAEQEELRRTVRTFLERVSPEDEVRRLMETEDGYDPAVWKKLSRELGLTGIHILEQFGGSGFSYVELCIALEEMGARLFCSPFFASAVLGAGALLESGDLAAQQDLLPG